MEEELDYMSDEFIKNCCDSSRDIRPGLLKTRNEQRQHKLQERKLESRKKPIELLQAEMREECLQKPINSSNRGFSILEKMGFKTGMGLGKDNSGIKEPIDINVKKDKVGLGHKSKQNRKTGNKSKKINEHEFRLFLSKKSREKGIVTDFKRSQKICKEFDLKSGKEEPEEIWFWPDKKEADEDDKVERIDTEKLERITVYLRDRYYYCVWCKVQFEDEKDMEECPGSSRDVH